MMSDYQFGSDHEYFRYVFGDVQARLSGLPHVVVPSEKGTFQLILRAIGRRGGIWGDYPFYDEQGGQGTFSRGLIEQFRLWKLKANQREMLERGASCKVGHLSIVIDMDTADETLTVLVNALGDYGAPFLENTWPCVIEHIEQLRWAYVPLEESPIAFFVASPSEKRWVLRVEEALSVRHIPFSHVIWDGGRETWNLGKELRQRCVGGN